MSPTNVYDWNRRRGAVAVAIPFPAGFEGIRMRDKLVAVRDTIIVLGLQIVFRTTMLLRRLNY
ncbi:MAG TPA: hypothetical protein VJO53_07390 [Candidatus Acidoferrales bacterium]|nr:hypothetical protein [Candidatus Acidoferrales bacterium]